MERLVVRALARRSQRSGDLWAWLRRYMQHYPLPRPKIIHAWYAATSAR